MKILKTFALITIQLCNGSNAIEDQHFLSNGEYGLDSNTNSKTSTFFQAYGSSDRRDMSTNPNLVQPDYIRIASLFDKKNGGRFCLQPRSSANPPARIVTKPCSDSEKQLFYVDEYGFLRWSSNKSMCLMRFTNENKSKVLVADYCDKGKDQEKLLYTSFDGAIVTGGKSPFLWAATFKGKVPKRNVVIKMKKRNYNSRRQLWKIEYVSATPLTPTSKPTTVAPTIAPTMHVPTTEPSSTPTAEPSLAPTTTITTTP